MTEATKQQGAPAAEPARGTPAYIEKMVGIYDAQRAGPAAPTPVATPTPEAPPAPAAMPEAGHAKFYDAKTGTYNWQAHAAEAEWKLAQKGAAPKPVATPEVPKAPDAAAAAAAEAAKVADPNAPAATPDPNAPPEADAAKAKVTEAGLDWDSLGSKIEQNGALDEADYEALTKVGIPKAIVDNYVQAMTVAREANQKTTYEYAGGKEVLDGALKWAATNMAPGEIAEVNRTLASANWRVGVDAVMSRYKASAKGAGEPTLVGGGNGAGSAAAFSSQAEMVAAINARDERGQRKYDNDPAYKASVRQRIALMQKSA